MTLVRIGGGIVLVLAGLWSMMGGSCAVIGGGLAGSLSQGVATVTQEMDRLAERSGTDRNRSQAASVVKKLQGASVPVAGLVASGIVVFVGGVLAVLAGAMFFFNQGRKLAWIAAGVGTLGELLFLVLVTFGLSAVLLAVVKLGFLAVGVWTSRDVGPVAT